MSRFFIRPQALLILVTIIWASTFVVTDDILNSKPAVSAPLSYLVLRFVIGAIVLLTWHFLRNKKEPLFKGITRQAIVIGLFQAMGLIFQVLAQSFQVMRAPTKVAFITGFSIPLAPILALLIYRDRPKANQLIGFSLGVFGIMLLTYPKTGLQLEMADLLALASALVWAGSIVYTAHSAKPDLVFRLAVGQTVVAAIFFCALLAIILVLPNDIMGQFSMQEHRWPIFSSRYILEILYMGVFCTALAFLGQIWCMARISTTEVAVIFSLESPFAMILGFIFLKEERHWPQPRALVGAFLIVAAVLIAEWRTKTKKK